MEESLKRSSCLRHRLPDEVVIVHHIPCSPGNMNAGTNVMVLTEGGVMMLTTGLCNCVVTCSLPGL